MSKGNSTDGVTPSRTISVETTLAKIAFGRHKYIFGIDVLAVVVVVIVFLRFLCRLNYYLSIHTASTVIYQRC